MSTENPLRDAGTLVILSIQSHQGRLTQPSIEPGRLVQKLLPEHATARSRKALRNNGQRDLEILVVLIQSHGGAHTTEYSKPVEYHR